MTSILIYTEEYGTSIENSKKYISLQILLDFFDLLSQTTIIIASNNHDYHDII